MSGHSRFTNGFLSSALAAAMSMAGVALPAREAEASNADRCKPQSIQQALATQKDGVRCFNVTELSSNPNLPIQISWKASDKKRISVLLGNPTSTAIDVVMKAATKVQNLGYPMAAVVIANHRQNVEGGNPVIQIDYDGASTYDSNLVLTGRNLDSDVIANKIIEEYKLTKRAEMAVNNTYSPD